jgi:hypothetical protein
MTRRAKQHPADTVIEEIGRRLFAGDPDRLDEMAEDLEAIVPGAMNWKLQEIHVYLNTHVHKAELLSGLLMLEDGDSNATAK